MAPPSSTSGGSPSSTLLTHTTGKGIQLFSLALPPTLLLHSLYSRRSPLPRKFLRNYGLGTFLVGGAFGLSLGAGRMSMLTEEEIAERGERMRWNKGQRDVDDWSVIGAVMGSVLVTTVMLRRAPIYACVLGGAAMGVATGVIAKVVGNQRTGTAQGVGMMVDEVKDAIKDVKPKDSK